MADAAYKTITEVADELALPAHVLRFWETKFLQIQPIKRSGGRRYYRLEDIALISRIRTLLHDEGYTIRGVQQLLDGEKRHKQTASSPPSWRHTVLKKNGTVAASPLPVPSLSPEEQAIKEELLDIRRDVEAMMALLEHH
jgi:DNA-binding transcriptional MerR regulator